jgi:hypothetical protein
MNKTHWSFWLIGVIALIWHVLGSANYLLQTSTEIVASLPETHQAIISTRPAWATGGFAVVVFGGAIASLLLLLRKTVAIYVFEAAVVGAVIASIHTARVANSYGFNGGEILVMIVSPVVVGALLVWYSIYTKQRHWIR